jgi:hypothetical protein
MRGNYKTDDIEVRVSPREELNRGHAVQADEIEEALMSSFVDRDSIAARWFGNVWAIKTTQP